MPLLRTLDGFELIFKENYSPLFRYVNGIVKDDEQSKDVLSDIFLSIWQKKDQLEIKEIKPYLFRSAKNGALKTLTSRQKNSPLSDDIFNIPADAYNPFEKFVAKQSIVIVEELVNKLSPLRKEIIELRLAGLKYYEIAEALAIPEKKVEYNMREAIEQLSKAIRHRNLDEATVAGGLLMIHLIFTITR
ncbi:MAG: hypothetical protein JWR50_2321 [Mucilaginibacter sp.]|nr:hypothetical protein [Mucilaginibacter sp.]